jgi:hypothetical protein
LVQEPATVQHIPQRPPRPSRIDMPSR